jgi:carbon-monoxide dehydrogenase medium subunit
MKAPDFRYHRPSSVEEAVALLGACEDARVLAGGQSLMPMLNLRVASPGHLIDLGGVASLVGIGEDQGELLIGAMTTQRALELSPLVAQAAPLLAEAVAHVGHQQTRNRGTIGGSLCHLDPGAELPVVAAALDAILVATGPCGSREIRFADFAMGYLTSSLAPDEILTAVRFPKGRARTGVAFLEFNRRPADFAIVSVAVTLSGASDGRLTHAAIALGGSYAMPVRLSEAEAVMVGHAPDESLFMTAASMASAVACDGDELYPGDYRQELAGTLVARALRLAAARIGSTSHD